MNSSILFVDEFDLLFGKYATFLNDFKFFYKLKYFFLFWHVNLLDCGSILKLIHGLDKIIGSNKLALWSVEISVRLILLLLKSFNFK
jgi:hypothetical protein